MHQNVCTHCGAAFPDDGSPHNCSNAGRVCGRCGASLEASGARLHHICKADVTLKAGAIVPENTQRFLDAHRDIKPANIDLCAACGHARESHRDMLIRCTECNCNCPRFIPPAPTFEAMPGVYVEVSKSGPIEYRPANIVRFCASCRMPLLSPGAELHHKCLRAAAVISSDTLCVCGHPRRDHGPEGESTRCWGPRGNARTCKCSAFALSLTEPVAHQTRRASLDPATGERIYVRISDSPTLTTEEQAWLANEAKEGELGRTFYEERFRSIIERLLATRLRIIGAALRLPSGVVLSLPPPARHHQVVHALRAFGFDHAPEGTQGFLLSDGSFADRHQAVDVARAAGQLLERAPTAGGWHAGLFSEDCW